MYFQVVDKILDELLEEISDQVKSAGLDPLPIPDIQLPFSMDNVNNTKLNKVIKNEYFISDRSHHPVQC